MKQVKVRVRQQKQIVRNRSRWGERVSKPEPIHGHFQQTLPLLIQNLSIVMANKHYHYCTRTYP